ITIKTTFHKKLLINQECQDISSNPSKDRELDIREKVRDLDIGGDLSFVLVLSLVFGSCGLVVWYSALVFGYWNSNIFGITASYTYNDLGDCDCRCRYCGASFWYVERLKGHSHNRTSEYNLCCGGGRIQMQRPREPPEYIKSLFENKNFIENIRAYNQMFAMTSFGAKVNESINVGRGSYVFKVSDQIYHWIGSLCPSVGERPRFLQQYIYNTDNELFQTARDKCRELEIPKFKIWLYNAKGARGYELLTTNTLGAMVFENGVSDNSDFDVIIQYRDGLPQRVNKLHRSYMLLHFLFIYGQAWYHTELTLKSANGVDKGKRVTMLAYYIYQLHFRLHQYDLLFRVGNLQFFITFTCSVTWPKIKRFMFEYQHLISSDRADVVCRVFKQKIQALISFLKEERIFGDVIGVLHTIKFQKRGLPHCHTLVWVDSASRIRIAKDIVRFVSAELPYPRTNLEGYNILSKPMLHGPCGAPSFKALCIKDDKCSKKFLKKFNQKTFFDENGHVHYWRRDTGVSVTRNEFQLDNNYVVPYNRDLLLAFRAHINVEYRGWSMLIKYLFKYISKGTDRVFARVSRSIGESLTSATPSRQGKLAAMEKQ
nr:DNA helicase [Tanacetum cinerariifolium]